MFADRSSAWLCPTHHKAIGSIWALLLLNIQLIDERVLGADTQGSSWLVKLF
jgi:hypothetical protein